MIDKEILQDAHWKFKDFKQRITVKQWREILINKQDSIIYDGNIVNLTAVNLGYGVVEVCKDIKEVQG